MESAERNCPICGQPLVAGEDSYTCVEHGAWYIYGARLLVRAPSDDDKAATRFLMPWEQLAPAP